MNASHLYLMAPPCSGKTHFAARHGRCRGYRVVDFSPINRRAVRDPVYAQANAPGATYFERIHAFLSLQVEAVCVLGRCGPPDPQRFAGTTLAAVLPPRERHEWLSDQRREANATSRWADFDEIEKARTSLQEYVARHDIPLYSSFEEALEMLGVFA